MPVEIKDLADKDQLLLDRFYQLWLDGADNITICKELGITEWKYKSLTPWLMAHCRHQLRHETCKDLADGKLPDRLRLTPERREEFVANVAAAGGDMALACAAMGVPVPTVTEVWYAEDPDLRMEVESAHAQAKLATVKALIKKAKGYAWDYDVRTETAGFDEKGSPRNTTSVTTGKKRAEPDFNSLRFYLINDYGDRFTIEGTGNAGASQGRILAAIDSMIQEAAEGEDEKFDKENSAG